MKTKVIKQNQNIGAAHFRYIYFILLFDISLNM